MTSSAPSNPAASVPRRRRRCRVWVVEDYDSVREFLASFVLALPGFQLVGSSDTAGPALAAAAQDKIDLVILDLMIPGTGGMDALREFSRLPAAPRVLIYSATATAHSVQLALQHGALGYVEKAVSALELRAALERVRAGGMHLSQRPSQLLTAMAARNAPLVRRPSQLELRALELLARGHTVKETAHDLGVSSARVYRIRRALMQRAQVKHPRDLIRYAIEVGVRGNSRP